MTWRHHIERTVAKSLCTYVAFKIPNVYDYITKLCRMQAELILNHVNLNVCGIGQGEARHRKYKRLYLAAVRPTTVQLTNCSSRVVTQVKA
jgi:hypothetical protein